MKRKYRKRSQLLPEVSFLLNGSHIPAAVIVRQYAKEKRMQKDGISLKKIKSFIRVTRLLPADGLLVKNILPLAAGCR